MVENKYLKLNEQTLGKDSNDFSAERTFRQTKNQLRWSIRISIIRSET